jgi:hypothetical protein
LLQLGISEEDTFIQKIVVKVFAQKVCKQSVPQSPALTKSLKTFVKSAIGEDPRPNNLLIPSTQDI